MGALTKSFDWSKTALGIPESWSQSLLTTVSIILNSKSPMFLWWGEDLIQFYNDAYRPSLGNEGKHPLALGQAGKECWPEIWPVVEPMIAQVMNGGESIWNDDQLIPIYRNNKLEDVYWSLGYSRVTDDTGKVAGVLVVCNETTDKVAFNELRQAKVSLQKAEESLRMATESAELGTWSLSADTSEWIASNQLKKIFGLAADEDVSYKELLEAVRADYKNYVIDAVTASLKRGERFRIEYPIIERREGKERWIRSVGKMMQDEFGNNSYLTGALSDITEQRNDEQRKNDFIGMVSHELKTPLTSLSAFVQMLYAKAKKSEDTFTAGALHQANKQVKKMTAMINGFLNISQLESGKINLNVTNFDIEELIKEVEDEISLAFQTHSIKFHKCKPIYVNADRDKIGQVITNLLSNAVKYSPKGESIDVECSELDGMIELRVKDNGIGISQQDCRKLFQRYFRASTVNHTISGFGIGLYICSEIINRHKGKIGVESEEEKGSTFWFSLPTE